MDTIVLKFGGSSVADNDKLRCVATRIINLYQEKHNIVVIVSAQGKTTDNLLKEAYELSKKPNERELDVLLSTGEQITISKLSILLNGMGYKTISLTGWQAGILTNNVNQNAIIENINCLRINNELKSGKIVIIAGFQGINSNCDITTLGRGGSDTTAISIAAALNASKCYIYSDVNGIFSTDPNKIENAKRLENISYNEMLEMSNEGAKVLHNRCVEIAQKFDIPIVAKSTFILEGETIVNKKIEEEKVKSIVKNDNLIQLSMSKKDINLVEVYKLFLLDNIIPNEITEEENLYKILLSESDFTKFQYIMETKMKEYDIEIKKISKISIIGNGILNNRKIIEDIINVIQSSVLLKINNKQLEKQNIQKNENTQLGEKQVSQQNQEIFIQKIDTNNGKIRIFFNTRISNKILEDLHKKLI